jgi:hypothetical protein
VAAVTRPYNGHWELLDEEHLLSPAQRSAFGQRDAGGDPKIGPYTRRGAETSQRGGRFHVLLGMQRPIGAAQALKNPKFRAALWRCVVSAGSPGTPMGCFREAASARLPWLSRNINATRHQRPLLIWTTHVLSGTHMQGPIGSSVCDVEKHSYVATRVNFHIHCFFIFTFQLG